MIVYFNRLKPYHARQMPRDIPDRSESSASEESECKADAEETNNETYVIYVSYRMTASLSFISSWRN